jgi:hypothetical protein
MIATNALVPSPLGVFAASGATATATPTATFVPPDPADEPSDSLSSSAFEGITDADALPVPDEGSLTLSLGRPVVTALSAMVVAAPADGEVPALPPAPAMRSTTEPSAHRPRATSLRVAPTRAPTPVEDLVSPPLSVAVAHREAAPDSTPVLAGLPTSHRWSGVAAAEIPTLRLTPAGRSVHPASVPRGVANKISSVITRLVYSRSGWPGPWMIVGATLYVAVGASILALSPGSPPRSGPAGVARPGARPVPPAWQVEAREASRRDIFDDIEMEPEASQPAGDAAGSSQHPTGATAEGAQPQVDEADRARAAPSAVRPVPGGPAPHALAPRAQPQPPPVRRAKPPSEAIRELFEARAYAGVVRACGAATVTAAIADLCTRAACEVHDMANAQLWLPLTSTRQMAKLVGYCSDLGNRGIRIPALDCSKDPLDCQ